MEIYLKDSAATEALGQLVGRLAEDGDVYCLNGDLGAGKTLFSRGVSEGLGIAGEEVTSPTFAIMNVYEGGRLPVRHFDLYRLNRMEELEDIGFDEYVGDEGVTLIEWAELFPEALPYEYLQIVLQHEGEGRKAILTSVGGSKRYEALIQTIEKEAAVC